MSCPARSENGNGENIDLLKGLPCLIQLLFNTFDWSLVILTTHENQLERVKI